MVGPEMTEACAGAAGWVLKGHLWQECILGPGGMPGVGVGKGYKQITGLAFHRGQGNQSAPISHAGPPSWAMQISCLIEKAKTSRLALSGEAGPPQVCPQGDQT